MFTPVGKCLRRISPDALKDLESTIQAKIAGAGCPEEMARSAGELWQSWLGYFRATEVPDDLVQACAKARDAVRRAIWTSWKTVSRRLEELRKRGVVELTQHEPSATLLLRAFPDEWFVRHGLSLGAPTQSGHDDSTDYNGKFRGSQSTPDNPWIESVKCWGWSLLRPGWFRMTCDVGRSGGGLIPRPEGLRFHLGRHQIVWRF